MKSFMKKGLVLILALSLMAACIAGCGGQAGNDENNQATGKTQFIDIATGGVAGTYYPLGGAIAEILNHNMDNVKATAQSTGASVANINLLNGGSVQLALVQNDVSYYADNGTELFKDNKIENLRCIATLYPETCQIITLKKTGIKTVADLRGKKVAVGAAGSGVEANTRQLLAANGLTYEDIKPRYLSFAEAASGLKDGNIDAGFITAGFPTAAIQDISAQHDVVILSIDEATANKLTEEYPYYTKITIPANTYQNQDKDVHSLAVKAMLITTADMDEDTAYKITKSIYTNLDRLVAAHSVGKVITQETARDGVSIKMHPGADKYFNE